MKALRLFLLGMIPLVPGYLLFRWGSLNPGNQMLAGVLVGVATLVFFYVAARKGGAGMPPFRALALLNGFGLLMLVLVCVQTISGDGSYWDNIFGGLSQWYFVPVTGISGLLLPNAVYGWMAPMSAWFLQALMSAIGSNIHFLRK